MANKNKIILMAQMAVYDKQYGTGDRAVFSYFRRDYIYRKNMWTRLCVSMGAVFLLGVYWLHQIFIYGIDIHELDIQQSVTDSVLFLLAVMALYTMIGTIQGTHQYHIVQKRMERYMDMMQKLEHIPDAQDSSAKEGDDSVLLYDEKQKSPRRRP